MLTVLLHVLAGAVLGAWAVLQAEWQGFLAWSVALGVAVSLLAGLGWWLARRTWPAVPARLRWDGSQWLCSRDGQGQPLARVVVALDLGTWVLLRLHPADGGAASWCVASARGTRGAWHGLRLALAAHAGAPRPADDDGLAP